MLGDGHGGLRSVGCGAPSVGRQRRGTTEQSPVLQSGLTLSPGAAELLSRCPDGGGGQTLTRALTWPLAPALLVATLVADLAERVGHRDRPPPTCRSARVGHLLARGRAGHRALVLAAGGLGVPRARHGPRLECADRRVRARAAGARGPTGCRGTDVCRRAERHQLRLVVRVPRAGAAAHPSRPPGRSPRAPVADVTVASGIAFQVRPSCAPLTSTRRCEDFVSPFAVQRLAGRSGRSPPSRSTRSGCACSLPCSCSSRAWRRPAASRAGSCCGWSRAPHRWRRRGRGVRALRGDQYARRRRSSAWPSSRWSSVPDSPCSATGCTTSSGWSPSRPRTPSRPSRSSPSSSR